MTFEGIWLICAGAVSFVAQARSATALQGWKLPLAHSHRQVSKLLGRVQILDFLLHLLKARPMVSAVKIKFPPLKGHK